MTFIKTNSLDETSFIAGKGKAAGVTEIYNENGQVHFQFIMGKVGYCLLKDFHKANSLDETSFSNR